MARDPSTYRAARRKLARAKKMDWRGVKRVANPYDAAQMANRQLDRDMDKAVKGAVIRAEEI